MHAQIAEIYKRYNDTLRPLVSEIEGRNESFEEPLLVDVASMFDAIALSEDERNDSQVYLTQASSFLDLSISHSYQYLIKNLHEKMLAFENRCNSSDRDVLDEGKFVGKYASLKKDAKKCVREGNRKSDIEALGDYERAYSSYSKIEKMIDRELPVQIMQNTRKDSLRWTIVGWAVSIILSVVIGIVVNRYADEIIGFLMSWKNV